MINYKIKRLKDSSRSLGEKIIIREAANGDEDMAEMKR